MSQKLFVPDYVNDNYHYALFQDDCIRLFAKTRFTAGERATCYTKFNNEPYDNWFNLSYVFSEDTNLSYQGNDHYYNYELTHNYLYHPQYFQICCTAFIYFLCTIFILNIVTSIIRKNGILGGLL